MHLFWRYKYSDSLHKNPILTARIQSRKKHWEVILNVINGLEYQNQLENILSDYGEKINHLLIVKITPDFEN